MIYINHKTDSQGLAHLEHSGDELPILQSTFQQTKRPPKLITLRHNKLQLLL
jgi:hypothetical protein